MNATIHKLDSARPQGADAPHDDIDVDPTELAAVRAALDGKLLARLKLGARALRGILRHPDDTRQVFTLFLVMNAKHIPGFLARFIAEPGAVALLHEQPALDSRSVDFAALARLPADTLGGAYARHLSTRGLSPDIFKAPPGVPPTIAYLAQRLRQSHDVWHVITGYDTSVDDELALLAFSYQQSKMPGPALLATVGAVRFSLQYPGVIAKVRDGFRRGKAARSLIAVRWEDLWTTPLAEVRERFAIEPRRA